MESKIQNQYNPDYVSPPGDTLLDVLEEREMTQAELAELTGKPKKTIKDIIKGKAAITSETALQLESLFNIPASFWNNRERHYREFLVRQKEKERLKSQVSWLKIFPVKDMIKYGWICRCDDKLQQLQEVLNFFAVGSFKEWEKKWCINHVYFRKSSTFDLDFAAVVAWLRRGEIEASEITTNFYDSQKFRESLQKIRSLTVKPPEIFQPEVVRLCAKAGVAVVFLPELPRMRTSGTTRWLNSDKALIQLSLRYKTDDHLWFTFFHEAGHILLHGKDNFFFEGKSVTSIEDQDKEKEADKFSENILIPPDQLKEFLGSQPPTKANIMEFASQIGIAPGIVVGRLQHDKVLPPNHCNDLKQKFEWVLDQKEN
ncbi:helix-turn-helix domain-containing protein [Cronbergia sp. UHCC 0137]|uniref:helix-turn-helix domain-containing protein n=1 Tax=Cronbergia sp. UHCC 0137 TaxID=3110239 RepID=UPI002B1F034A|nr:helix-turn-helix domain-containing protein [Cronbergia sp. UHCC 0137]MEA5616377.1 helix-turn-helix domain-containing protein [Cronbergia sp. UHCC 0137]